MENSKKNSGTQNPGTIENQKPAELTDYKAIIQTNYGSENKNRLVGVKREIDSGYDNIHRFFGKNGIKPSLIQIRHSDKRYQFSDEKILTFANNCQKKLREQGRLKDGPDVTRLVSVNLTTEPESKTITIQRATYGQFAGSCFFLDTPDSIFGKDKTLRAYYTNYMSVRESSTSADNPLAACFGVSAMVLIEEDQRQFILRTRRSANLATLTGTYGASVAGVVDYLVEYENLWQLMRISLAQEVREEINLNDNEFEIIPLAYTHELFRGEHPQLFCLVRCSLSREALTQRFSEIKAEEKEFDRFDFLPLRNRKLQNSTIIEEFNFEGKMSYYLTEEYLSSD